MDDRVRVTAALPSTGERYDTESTHIVTTPSDRDKSCHPIAIEANRRDVGISLVTREQHIDRIAAIVHLLQEVRQVLIRIGAYD